MSASNRLSKLEQRPQQPRPHRMTQDALHRYMATLTPREVDAFVKTMTEDDLQASIDYLQTLQEQEHENT
jgi:hypothetical protein